MSCKPTEIELLSFKLLLYYTLLYDLSIFIIDHKSDPMASGTPSLGDPSRAPPNFRRMISQKFGYPMVCHKCQKSTGKKDIYSRSLNPKPA